MTRLFANVPQDRHPLSEAGGEVIDFEADADRSGNNAAITPYIDSPISPGAEDADVAVPHYAEGAAAEDFRALASELSVHLPPDKKTTLAIVSPDSDEAVAYVIANLAGTMAARGARIIALDANLRAPALHRYFSLTNDAGLASALSDLSGQSFAEPRTARVTDRLTIVPAGISPQPAAELLGGRGFATALASLTAAADIVLIATPSDALADVKTIVRQATAVLIVITAHRTRVDRTRRLLEVLKGLNVPTVGTVFLDLSRSRFRRWLEARLRKFRRRSHAEISFVRPS